MSHKTKNKLLSLKERLTSLRVLLLAFAFFASTLSIGLTLSVPAYAQTQGEAAECYGRYNGHNLFPGAPVNEFENMGCKFSNGQGNCLFVSEGENFGPVRCSPRPDTAPVPVDAGINDLDECVEKEDLSFDWGVDCIDTPGLVSFVFGVLASIVGIAVVGGIAWGGMIYTTSNGNSSKAQQGITIIVNAVIGLLIFIFLFALTNFLIPGGIFRG